MNKEHSEYSHMIGKKVSKVRKGRVPKPFKSGFKVNTVKEITINPNTQKPAFLFIEDDSVVDCHICSIQE
jgi:sporulation protein YlmC with PRC-barrel domain